MSKQTLTLELSPELYDKLASLATEADVEIDAVIARLVEQAYQQREWLKDLNALRAQIQAAGGLQVGSTKEAVVTQLRETRQMIFDTEYAHLYR